MAVQVLPLEEAISRISGKTPIGSVLRSAEWAQVPQFLRDRAFFSAGIESVRLLDAMQGKLLKSVSLLREQVRNGEALVDRSSFIADVRKDGVQAGVWVDPLKKGGLQDITSRRRLGMIFDIQIEQAREYARWKAEQDPDVLAAFPAQELVRLEAREMPRKWLELWTQAGGRLIDGRMIALKGDPIWRRISRFGLPFPPFDFNSGMGLVDHDREAAEAWGLLGPGDEVVPAEAGFNDALQASIRDLQNKPKLRQALEHFFGDQISIDGDVVHWRGQTPQAVNPPVKAGLQPGGTAVSVAADFHYGRKADAAKMRSALDAIDSVHGDGALLLTRFDGKVEGKSDGTYYGKSLGVKSGVAGFEFHAAHEAGHWLDHQGMKSPGTWASESSPLFEGFFLAVKATASYQQLDTIADTDYRGYTKDGREVWARAYAQFVATRSRHPAMMEWLDRVRADETGYFHFTQWPDAEFAPIAAEIETMFRKLGWLK